MAKQSGLGDAFYIGGVDISGDTQQLTVSAPIALLDVTDITQSAHSRLTGHRDGKISATVFWDPAVAHPALSALPTADTQVMYCRGTALGNPAAAMVAKQINYDGTRAADGLYTFASETQGNGFGLEWGNLLTTGLRTDTVATNGTSVDQLAQTAFGAQAYLQVTAFTGTDVTIKVQDSADNVSFADVTGLTFAQTTSAPGTQRIATANNATIRRYLRAVTVTTGGFTSVTFAVMVNRNPVAGVTF